MWVLVQEAVVVVRLVLEVIPYPLPQVLDFRVTAVVPVKIIPYRVRTMIFFFFSKHLTKIMVVKIRNFDKFFFFFRAVRACIRRAIGINP